MNQLFCIIFAFFVFDNLVLKIEFLKIEFLMILFFKGFIHSEYLFAGGCNVNFSG